MTSAATDTTRDFDLATVNARLADVNANEAVRWAADIFGDGLAMTTSFGAQSAVMLHLITQVKPDIPVIWVDTGYNFDETYKFADELTERLSLNLKTYHPKMSPAHMEARLGKLWEQGVDGLNTYDFIRKVEPMERALDELNVTAWLAGLRKTQTDHRSRLPRVEQRPSGTYKIYPILHWSTKDVHEYLTAHDLPYHPMYEKGYPSIGDWHSTFSINEQQDERAGRFKGLKQECGIHLPRTAEENESLGSAGL